jgi:predicted transcriptional regulator
MSKRISVVLSDEVAESLEKLAAKERRSQSQMGAILIEEALQVREEPQEDKTPSSTKKGKGEK